MKKVLIVGPKKSQHIQKWYSISQDLDLYLFTIDPGGSCFVPRVKEYNFRIINRKISLLLSIPLFIYTWWKVRPDVTNFHYLSSYGLLSLFVPKKNLILSTWGSDVNNFSQVNSGLHVKLIKKALSRFSWINAPAMHMKNKLIKLGADSNLIDVYQYGIPEFEKKVSRSDDVVKFVSNRNWGDVYRIDKVIDGFVYLLDNYEVNAVLYLYGGGEKIGCRLKKLFGERPELVDYILLKGYTEHSVMISDMKLMDVFVSVPKTDGMPLSLLEAMEIGLYPVVSDIDANHEWIDSTTGLICNDVDNQESFGSALWDAYTTYKKSKKLNSWQELNREKVRTRGRLSTNVNLFLAKVKSLS